MFPLQVREFVRAAKRHGVKLAPGQTLGRNWMAMQSPSPIISACPVGLVLLAHGYKIGDSMTRSLLMGQLGLVKTAKLAWIENGFEAMGLSYTIWDEGDTFELGWVERRRYYNIGQKLRRIAQA